uniref:PRA1 family protein n=1 Tax=Syphacia muris TaxID=451379 RepID=A0A0N5AXI6_9BILA
MAQQPTSSPDSDRSPRVNASAEAEPDDTSKSKEVRQNSVEEGFIDLIKSWKDAIKPWSEFFSPRCFGLPLPIKLFLKRIKKNISYFPANYVVILLLILFCCIVTSFWLLISTILLSVLFVFIRSKTAKRPLVVGDEEIPSWFLYASAVFAVIPLLILADVGYLLYCAVGASIIIILIHATFYSGRSKKKASKSEALQVVVQKSKESQESKELLKKTSESVTEAEVLKSSHVRFTEGTSK